MAELKPRKKPAQERSKAMVKRILQAAAELLSEEGYNQMSTNHIARHAGVSVGSLYQYFPNKNAIVLALIERLHERHMEVISTKLQEIQAAEEPSLETAVRSIVHGIIEACLVDPKLTQVLLREVRHLDEFHALREWVDNVGKMVETALRQRQDMLRATDPSLAAYIIVNAVNGVILSAELDHNEMIKDPRFADEVCELAVRYLQAD
jgi:AcrR family transcriptional regulator